MHSDPIKSCICNNKSQGMSLDRVIINCQNASLGQLIPDLSCFRQCSMKVSILASNDDHDDDDHDDENNEFKDLAQCLEMDSDFF